MKRIAVLGATGFVGRNVWNFLKEAGHEVYGLSRTSGCDLKDLSSTWRALDPIRPDYIVNCAAHVGSVNYVADFAADVVTDNMLMILNVYKVAQQLRETVVITPIANCGYPGHLDLYREQEFWDGPIHPSVLSYGSTRRMVDVLANCFQAQYGVRSANVFVPNMYGPYDSTNPNKTHALNALVIKFVRALKEGRSEIEVWGTGRPIREWLYVKDFARVVVQMIGSSVAATKPLNIAQNHGLSVDDLVGILVKLTGFAGGIVKNSRYPDGAAKKVMDDVQFRKVFPGFAFTSLEDGLAETVRYYQKLL